MTKLESALERARQQASTLAVETDNLNAAITALEGAIAGLHLGVYGFVEFVAGDGEVRRLSFGKIDREWRLQIECDSNVVALVSVSREVRLAAVDYLAELAETLIATVDQEIDRARAKTAQVVELAAVCSKGKK